jgi:aryl-alcohol dehydrogenase-like predicted oxidoreductase
MSMSYRRLGLSGLKVSALSFGAWVTFGKQIGDPVARDLMHTAYAAGVNFFDNAETYADGQAEIVMGDILKHSGWPRDTFLVSSKVFFGATREGPNQTGLSRKHVIEACHDALRRLQVDYLDLYYCHRPDPEVPVEETARAMHDLITQGKVLYWGTSEWSAADLTEAFAVCTRLNLHRPVVEQPQYNLFPPPPRRKGIRPVLPFHPDWARPSGRPSPPACSPANTTTACPPTPGSIPRAWNGCAIASPPTPSSAPASPPSVNSRPSPANWTPRCPASRWPGA